METFNLYNQGMSKNSNQRDFQIQPHHIQFQTNDSEASDTSYQSSLSSNQQNNVGNAEYFREEMSRFFINYPELLNQQLVGGKTNEKSLWGDIAHDIINQAKQQPISLQGIAKRIAFYRQKTQQMDIIDLIVKQKDLILKQLDEQAKTLEQENINPKNEQGGQKRNILCEGQNTYYSWKKKQEAILINKSRKNSEKKIYSLSVNNKLSYEDRIKENRYNSVNRINKKNTQATQNKIVKNNSSVDSEKDTRRDRKNVMDRRQNKAMDTKNNTSSNFNSHSNSRIKNILKFQPKTQTAKQLLEEIKKHHPNDEIGIKKTIINFICRHREAMKKNILAKSSLNQRLSKLHIQDSKELLLFCPLKKNSIETDMPLNTQTNKFLEILTQISSGHLMKYWKLLQQKKL